MDVLVSGDVTDDFSSATLQLASAIPMHAEERTRCIRWQKFTMIVDLIERPVLALSFALSRGILGFNASPCCHEERCDIDYIPMAEMRLCHDKPRRIRPQ